MMPIMKAKPPKAYIFTAIIPMEDSESVSGSTRVAFKLSGEDGGIYITIKMDCMASYIQRLVRRVSELSRIDLDQESKTILINQFWVNHQGLNLRT